MIDQDFNFDVRHPPVIICPDFETLSLDSDAVIIGMGSTVFSPGGPHRNFVSAFPINALGQVGRRADPDTVNWWSVQPDNGLRLCFQRAMAGDGPSLQTVLHKFLEECKKIGGERGVWWLFKPACFDGALFRHACVWAGLGPMLEEVGLGASRRRMLDLQSIRFGAAWAGIEVPENVKAAIQHHPVQDAMAQGQSGDRILMLLRDAISGAPEIDVIIEQQFTPDHPDTAAKLADHITTHRPGDAPCEIEGCSRNVGIDMRAGILEACDRYLRGDAFEGLEPLPYIGAVVHALIVRVGQGLVVDGHELDRMAQLAMTGERPDNFPMFLAAVKTMISDTVMCTDAMLEQVHAVTLRQVKGRA